MSDSNAGVRRRTGVDEVDRLIVEQLQQDGRRSFGRIGEAVGLSETGARKRVQRLVDDGTIKIVATISPEALGAKLRATLGLHTTGDMVAVAEAVAAVPEIDYVVTTVGSFDVLAEVQCEDEAHLLAILNRSIRAIAGVVRVETLVHLRVHKETYPWPPTGPATDLR